MMLNTRGYIVATTAKNHLNALIVETENARTR